MFPGGGKSSSSGVVSVTKESTRRLMTSTSMISHTHAHTPGCLSSCIRLFARHPKAPDSRTFLSAPDVSLGLLRRSSRGRPRLRVLVIQKSARGVCHFPCRDVLSPRSRPDRRTSRARCVAAAIVRRPSWEPSLRAARCPPAGPAARPPRPPRSGSNNSTRWRRRATRSWQHLHHRRGWAGRMGWAGPTPHHSPGTAPSSRRRGWAEEASARRPTEGGRAATGVPSHQVGALVSAAAAATVHA